MSERTTPSLSDAIKGTLKGATHTRIRRVVKDADGHFFVESAGEVCCAVLNAFTSCVAITVGY
jgi:hypothetical protein